MGSTLPVVVTYEDRPSALDGAEMMVRSLHRHSPDVEIRVYSPLSAVADRLRDVSTFRWIPTDDLVGQGWNIKPRVLTRALGLAARCCWLDTDIIVLRDIRPTLLSVPSDAVAVGEEYHLPGEPGGRLRCEAHGMKCGRSLAHGVNSGSTVFARCHLDLLDAWSDALASSAYQEAQQQPVSQRPMAFVGDQDVLWAALVSERFSDLAVMYFRTGLVVTPHCGANGYHVVDRLRDLTGSKAVFTHMLGSYKPWSFASFPDWYRQPRDYFHLVCYELSPFFEAGRAYASHLSHPVWLTRRTLPAKILSTISLGCVPIQGMPLALAAWAAAGVKGFASGR
ncbi:MAG: hypothetical protein RLN76_12425 [Phycisphaeraceae bacterium]